MGAELFAVPFALSLVLLCVIQLIFHAVMCLVFRVSPWKQMAAQSVLVRLVEFVSSAGMVVTRTLVDAGVRLLGLWLLFITAFIIFSAIWVTYEEYPQTWLGFVSFYNANLGPFVSRWLVVPLQIADTVLRSLIPIYDCVVWWAKALLFQGLLPITLQEIQTIFKIASALLQFSKDWATASLAFTDSFRCAGDACLVPESRAFDLLSSLGQVREIVALGRQLAAAFCSALSAPLDALIFPLLDLNFSLGVHNLWNFLLQLTVVVPHVTYERCALAKNDTFAVMMCVPDAEPIFNYLVAALSSFGLAVDNWFNVILVIVQNVLSGTAPTCQSDVVDMTPTSFMESSVFAGNFTAVVGLTQWMYAVTDGYTAIYKGSDDLSVRAQQWPYAMDPSLGVAAVTYGATSDPDGSSISGGNTAGSVPTTAMLACNCSDTPVGVEILCAILPLGGVPPGKAGSSYLLQVLFPDEQTPAIIGRCAAVDISVHSNRFSATRFQTAPVGLGGSTASAVPAPDCVTRGTCREVDATVYVVPRCGDPGNMACIGQCMPFCMAVRPSGSANNNLQLLPASRWRTGYATLAQDCALGTAGVLSVNPGLRTSGSSSTVTAPPGTLTQGVAAGVFAAGPTRACQPAKRVLSVQPRPGAADSIRAATRLPSQPLFTTGDTVFTERKLGGGASAVVVERLTSDDHSTFTLSTLSQDFPALATLDVQSEESTFDDPTRMLIPSAGYYRPVVAVSSRNYVFYAAPPALQCMEAYMEYCRLKALGSNELPSMGFLLTSSYAPIRVYRVSA